MKRKKKAKESKTETKSTQRRITHNVKKEKWIC